MNFHSKEVRRQNSGLIPHKYQIFEIKCNGYAWIIRTRMKRDNLKDVNEYYDKWVKPLYRPQWDSHMFFSTAYHHFKGQFSRI